MFGLASSFFEEVMKNAVTFVGELFGNKGIDLLEQAIFFENSISGFTNLLNSVSKIILIFAICLILLKFVFKGFNTYVLWLDEDAAGDPLNSLTGLIKALAVAICFGEIYKVIGSVALDLGTRIINQIMTRGSMDVFASDFYDVKIGALPEALVFGTVILWIVYLICFLIIYIKILMMSIELWVLKTGAPLACVGMLDSNQELWQNYFEKFLQAFFTIIIMISLTYLSYFLVVESIFIGIAMIVVAMKSPSLLERWLVRTANANVNHLTQNAYYASRGFKAVKSFFKGG